MRTDRVQVALRQRGGLQAVDLGFAMARVWWRPLLTTWLAIVLPIGGVLVVALRDHPFWAILILWWLRPVFDRVPLHVLSRALFSETTGLMETVRALPTLLRTGLGTSLVLQRLSPARTFVLPVLQLEGLRGPERRARCAALARHDMNAAMALLSVGSLCNAALMLGLLLIVGMLVPNELAWDAFDLLPFGSNSAPDHGFVLLSALYLTGTSFVEPLLVAGGFALYINRRVYLEGWDIDLAFRQLARRKDAPARPSAARGAAAAGCLALVAAGTTPAHADGSCDPVEPESASSCIELVLEQSDFGSVEEIERWVPREFDKTAGFDFSWLGWLPGLLATGIELLLWTGLAAALIALMVVAARRGQQRVGTRPAPLEAISTRFGIELDARSLPDDVVAAARSCWARGARIEALSLLYRGALVHLIERSALEIPQSATELECVGLVERSQHPDRAKVFLDLTHAWLGARYANEPPQDGDFEALCRRFGPIFGAAA